jgi:hypothetical protein
MEERTHITTQQQDFVLGMEYKTGQVASKGYYGLEKDGVV